MSDQEGAHGSGFQCFCVVVHPFISLSIHLSVDTLPLSLLNLSTTLNSASLIPRNVGCYHQSKLIIRIILHQNLITFLPTGPECSFLSSDKSVILIHVYSVDIVVVGNTAYFGSFIIKYDESSSRYVFPLPW